MSINPITITAALPSSTILLVQAGSTEAGYPEIYIQVLNISKDGDCNLCKHLFHPLNTLTINPFFPMFSLNILFFSLFPLPLILSQDITEKNLASPSLLPLPFSTLIRCPSAFSSPGLTIPFPFLIHVSDAPVPKSSSYFSRDLLWYVSVLLYMGDSRTGEEKGSICCRCSQPNTAQDATGLLCYKDTFLAHGSLVHQDAQVTRSFSAELFCSWLVSSLCW